MRGVCRSARAATKKGKARIEVEQILRQPWPVRGRALCRPQFYRRGADGGAGSGQRSKLAKFPWQVMKLPSPVWPLAREMPEMRYLWELPHALDGARLAQLLPTFAPTAADDIFRQLVARPGV